MILSTLVTKTLQSRYKKAISWYSGISIFCLLFPVIYERFSFGEHSNYMRGMALAPIIALTSYTLAFKFFQNLFEKRLTYQLFNASVATVVFGCLIKGIIEVSGRSTDFEKPYWFVAAVLLATAIATRLFSNKKQKH